VAKGEKGEYCVVRQRPDRRNGIYRWRVTLRHAEGGHEHIVGSTEQLSAAKGLAAHHDRNRACAENGIAEGGPPDPSSEYAQVQRMMQLYVRRAGLGEYVLNSAIPTGRVVDGDGIWSFYVRPAGGGKGERLEVANLVLRKTYERYGASEGASEAGVERSYDAQVAHTLKAMGRAEPERDVVQSRQELERMKAAGIEPRIAAAILDASLHHMHAKKVDFDEHASESREAPTRGEWEVVVSHPPAEHRGAILSMGGPGYGYESGGKIYLTGFYDDEEARHVAASISRKYGRFGSSVTIGPRRSMAAEDSHPNEGRKKSSDVDAVLTLVAYATDPQSSLELGFIPTVVRYGKEDHGWSKERTHAALLAAAERSLVELRPESGLGRLTPEEKALCIPGPHGTVLSWARLLEGGSEGAEERRRPGAHRIPGNSSADGDCEHGCPTGECKPFTKLERDPTLFKQCMARAASIGELSNSRKLYDLVRTDLERRDREVFVVICIDFRGQLRDYVELSIGQRHRVAVDVEDILQIVFLSGADGFAVAHVHPSGNAEPSPADGKLTKSIEKAAAVACPNVKMVDHIVVGMSSYYSFSDRKLYKNLRN
jgi:DNA repair protein RadC